MGGVALFLKFQEKLNFILVEVLDSFSPIEAATDEAATDDSSIADMTQVFANSSMEDNSMSRSVQFADDDDQDDEDDQNRPEPLSARQFAH